MSKSKEPTGPKEYDRRPWPKIGDANMETTHASVGRAISRWEVYDGVLSVLFSAFVSPSFTTKSAMRAYSAVRTFEGRLDMLRAASAAYFDEQPETELLAAFKEVLRNASCFSPRRNEITHAAVANFLAEDGTVTDTYALYPAYVSFKERDLKNKPTYCMTSTEINYFDGYFLDLQKPVTDLASRIASRPHRRT
jgi:hypothetical protein